MRVRVTELAFRRGQAPADRGAAVPERGECVTLAARRLVVGPRERPPRKGSMIEIGDLEGRRRMALVARERRRGEAKLAEMRIVMAAAAVAGHAAVARAAPRLPILVGRMVATVAFGR